MKKNDQPAKKYEQVQTQTIHDIFKLVLLAIFVTTIPASILSSHSTEHKIFLMSLSVVSFLFISGLIHILNKHVSSTRSTFTAYTIIVIIYTVLFALFSAKSYLAPTAVAFTAFTIIIANTYSYSWFILQVAISYSLLIFFGFKVMHETITLSGSYFTIMIGSYTAVVLVLFRNMKSYYFYNTINTEQVLALKKAQEDLLYNYEHDFHCHCLNRAGLISTLNKRILSGDNSFYLALLDIDGFKYLMATLGHSQSEMLMKELIIQLQTATGCEEIAKMGSDKILLVFSSKTSRIQVFHSIRNMIKSISTNNMTFSLTCCLGFADASQEATANELLHHAETALYNAKEKGKDTYADYDKNYISQLNRQFQIYSSMIDGVRNHEFYNLYQPQVDLRTRHITGFEALVRWDSKTLGLVPPSEFISIAEYTGVILELGYEIMKNAMTFAHEASFLNPDIVVSINISLHQLMDDYFCDKTIQYLKTTKANARNIAFEVTESIYAENISHISNILYKIKNIGISIYLDDFGTGYSSLSYLNMLPIDILKIDKAFINSIHTNEKSVQLLKNIIQLAESLKLDCVAEGVENILQQNVLKELGCYNIQGFFYDRPLVGNTALLKLNAPYTVQQN